MSEGVGGLMVLPEEGLQRKVPEGGGGTPFSGDLRKDSPEGIARTGVGGEGLPGCP